MKNGTPCAKCASKRVIKVPGNIGTFGAGNNIHTSEKVFSAIKLTRFVCVACGFVEDWVEAPEDLHKIEEQFGSH